MAEPKNQNSEPDAFSQDDIDQLLRSASDNAAEGTEEIDSLLRNISREETAPDQNEMTEDNLFDDISPSDINDFLNTALADISVDDLEADLLQSQSQDMDSIDSGNQDAPVDTQKVPEQEAELETAAGGDISQDDIDKMLAGNADVDPVETEAEPMPEPEADAGGDISQGDIDKLLSGNADIAPTDTEAKPMPEPEAETGGDISQNDIDMLLAGETEADTPVPEESAPLPEEEEDRSLYISQNELDQILEEYTNDPPDMKEKAEQDKPPSQDEEITTQSETTKISQNDIDMLLSPDFNNTQSGHSEPEEGLISQEDIDNLLQSSDDESETEEDPSSLISQEDIDLLLKGVDDDSPEDPAEEDEADPDLSDDDGSGLVSQEDIDSLLRDDIDQEEVPSDTQPHIELDRVVLEEDDEPKTDSEEDPRETEETGKKKWYRSKLLIACSLGTIVFLTFSVSLYLFLSGDQNENLQPEMASIESKPIEEGLPVVDDAPADLSIDFNDFIVLAPLQRDDVSYLKADVQVTCASETAVEKIISQKPFFRFIIYDTFQKTLATLESPENEKEPSAKNQKEGPSTPESLNFPVIDQTKLKSAIRLSLEKAMPEKGIQEIVLKNITLS